MYYVNLKMRRILFYFRKFKIFKLIYLIKKVLSDLKMNSFIFLNRFII